MKNDDYTIDQVHFRALVLCIHTWNFINPRYSAMPPFTQKKSNPIQTGWCAIINLSFWKNYLQEMNYALYAQKERKIKTKFLPNASLLINVDSFWPLELWLIARAKVLLFFLILILFLCQKAAKLLNLIRTYTLQFIATFFLLIKYPSRNIRSSISLYNLLIDLYHA